MPSATSVSLALAGFIIGAAGGYWMGLDYGALQVRASTDSQSVTKLTELIESQKTLTVEANKASQQINTLVAERQRHDYSTTRTLKEVLDETAALRADCRFDDRVMRELTEARNRAARAVTGGLDGALPTTGEPD